MSDKAIRVANDATQSNRYSSPFVLDGAKLTRILTVIEERFGEADFEQRFDVTLKNGKQVKVAALDALLKLDNTIKNPVTSLDIAAQSNDLHTSITFDDSERKNILVGVWGSNPKIVGELFAELEEQVERTMVGGWFSKLGGSSSRGMLLLLCGNDGGGGSPCGRGSCRYRRFISSTADGIDRASSGSGQTSVAKSGRY